MSLSRFGIRVMLVSQNELGSIPSFSISWRILYKIGNFSAFNVWENSPIKASGSEVFFVGRFETINSISIVDKSVIQVIYFFLSMCHAFA